MQIFNVYLINKILSLFTMFFDKLAVIQWPFAADNINFLQNSSLSKCNNLHSLIEFFSDLSILDHLKKITHTYTYTYVNIVNTLFKNKGNFYFSQKIFICSSIVPIKVIPLRCNTLVPVLFSFLKAFLISTVWYNLELFQRCSFLSPQLQQISILSWGKKLLGAQSGEYGG